MGLVVPARIPPETADRVRELAVAAFLASECEGMARVDFFVREDGEVVVNELNTIPGFTATSVYAKLFAASGIPYAALLDRLIELALERHERRSQLEFCAPGAEHGGQGLFPDRQRLVQLAVGDHERAENPDAVRVKPRLQQQQAALCRLLDHGARNLWRRLLQSGV